MKDSVTLYSIKTLLNNSRGSVMYSRTKRVPLGLHLITYYAHIVEDINDIELIDIIKVSPRKWQVTNIITSDNAFDVEDEKIFLSPSNFDLKVLTEQVDIYRYSGLFGVHLVSVSKWEYENFPAIFSVYDESGKELTQSELESIAKSTTVRD
jgi:hypothetical protein